MDFAVCAGFILWKMLPSCGYMLEVQHHRSAQTTRQVHSYSLAFSLLPVLPVRLKHYNDDNRMISVWPAGCGHTIQAFPHSHRTTNPSQVRGSDLTFSICCPITDLEMRQTNSLSTSY